MHIPPEPLVLGIEGGGTRTTALLANGNLSEFAKRQFGPGNVRLLSERDLEKRFREIKEFVGRPSAIGIGMAGARDERDRERIRQAIRKVWGAVSCAVTHDLEIALRAADTVTSSVQVLVLSGTGSCCYGLNSSGAEAKLGGWGHLLGDRGSGFEIGLNAVRAAIYELDRHGRWEILGTNILRHLLLNDPEDLISWVQKADKSEIANLAIPTFAAAKSSDKLAKEILNAAALSLANDAILCSQRLASTDDPVDFVLAGSVLAKQPPFAREVGRRIKVARPPSKVRCLEREGVWGAVKMALSLPIAKSTSVPASFYIPEFVPEESPTEQRNPKSTHLDKLSIGASIVLMLEEEEGVADALRRERKSIEKAVRLCSDALKKGGRIFYVGAGTSGRLGVLDASECPPTFRASPEMIQGIMAGGCNALWQAVEGAEDDANAGAQSVRARGVRKNDAVLGIAASGRTPFVWGALAAARELGAKTILLMFNPALRIARKEKPDILIAPNLGPEILTGSTRLKCGSATKLVLNMISTISMVRLGKVASNLMIDLNPSNVKLRDRAIRIIQELTSVDRAKAQETLEQTGWVLKEALKRLKQGKRPRKTRATSNEKPRRFRREEARKC